MPTLPLQLERFIVKELACDADPESIVDDMSSKFLRDVTVEDIRAYDPEGDGSALRPELDALYQETRRSYLGPDETEEPERTFVTVATTGEISGGDPHCVDADGDDLLLLEHDGEYRALDNTCTHQGGPLCEGEVSDDTITCPWHGAEFDLETGDPAGPPAVGGVTAYEVRVQGDEIEVKI